MTEIKNTPRVHIEKQNMKIAKGLSEVVNREGQTTQWPKRQKKTQKYDKQWSTILCVWCCVYIFTQESSSMSLCLCLPLSAVVYQ